MTTAVRSATLTQSIGVNVSARIFAVAALLMSGATQAQQCPGSNSSWSVTAPPPAQFVVYDLESRRGISPGLLTVLYNNRSAETFFGVPGSVAQSVARSASPLQRIAVTVRPAYHSLLLLQPSNCPLETSLGALWTR